VKDERDDGEYEKVGDAVAEPVRVDHGEDDGEGGMPAELV